VGDRVLRLGYFTSQPDCLLTALCDNGDRVDLLVIAPDAEPVAADAAMTTAATTGNLVHAQNILSSVAHPDRASGARETTAADSVWDDDGGPLAGNPHVLQPVVPIG
jgi:hypothetical protein